MNVSYYAYRSIKHLRVLIDKYYCEQIKKPKTLSSIPEGKILLCIHDTMQFHIVDNDDAWRSLISHIRGSGYTRQYLLISDSMLPILQKDSCDFGYIGQWRPQE
jgi:hypothetical protein